MSTDYQLIIEQQDIIKSTLDRKQEVCAVLCMLYVLYRISAYHFVISKENMLVKIYSIFIGRSKVCHVKLILQRSFLYKCD